MHSGQENDGQESDDDAFAEFRWMEQMDGVVLQNNALHPEKPSQVDYCDAKLIRRSRMYSFYSDLEQPSQETCRLAFELFDRYGRLKNEFKEHAVKKGSGIWGDELDSGDLLLIEQISLKAPYRRQGLGSKLVEAILEKTCSKSNSFFAVVAPGWLHRIVSMETEGASDIQIKKVELLHQATAESFFRSLGFRRVGSSTWLALASSPEHPCHSLDAAADFEMPDIPPRLLSSQQTELFESCSGMKDQDLLPHLQKKLGDKFNPLWSTINDKGNTILHCSAIASKNTTASWILDMRPDLKEWRNNKGETALDALLDLCETKRTQRQQNAATLSVSDEFKGFPDTTTSCLAVLKGMSSVNKTEKLRLKFGCTCGRCIRGFLSPRMRFTLRNQAEHIRDMLELSTDMPLTEYLGEFVDSNAGYLRYVPVPVLNKMRTSKSTCQGFATMFSHFEQRSRIETSKGLLNQPNILLQLDEANEWPPHSKNYLKQGGTIYAVGSCLFESAMNEDDIAGDGDPDVLDEDEKKQFENSAAGVKLREELAGLPKCRNDLEYGFVSAQLGYKMVSREYYHMDQGAARNGLTLNSIRQMGLLGSLYGS